MNYMYTKNYLETAFLNGEENKVLEALSADGSLLAYIKSPTYKMKKTAVSQCGLALKYCANPEDELIRIAIKNSPTNAQYVSNPDKKTIATMIEIDPNSIRYITSGVTKLTWKKCVYKCPQLIRYIPRKFIDKEMIEYVGIQDIFCIKYIPSELIDSEIQKKFVTVYGSSLQFLNVEDEEVYFIAMQQDPISAKYVNDIEDIDRLVKLIKENNTIAEYLNFKILKKVCNTLINYFL